MIDKRLEKLISRIKSIHLSQTEKEEVLNRVLLVVDKIEAVSISSPTSSRPIKSPFIDRIVSYIEYKKFVPAFVIAMLLFVSGGVSLAAERALPGDSLFGLKKVNEEVLSFAAVSAEAKARLALEVSERRLQEAATLSVQGKLTTERKAIVQQEFKKQASQVKNQVASLISENNIAAAQEIALNFESSLKAHEELFAKVAIADAADTSSSTPEDQASVTALLATIQDELATSTVARVDLQNKEIALAGNSSTKAELKIKEVSDKVRDLKDAKNRLAAAHPQTAINTVVAVGVKLAEADRALEKAISYKINKQFSDVILVVQQADRAASDAQSILDTEKNAHIAVRKLIETTTTSAAATAIASTTDTASSTSATSTDATSTPTTTVTTPNTQNSDVAPNTTPVVNSIPKVGGTDLGL
ncbi:MAG: hypothetical protein RL094_549 [Candidatus Parcubacteria bacterium]|jgi:hypothetical protein